MLKPMRRRSGSTLRTRTWTGWPMHADGSIDWPAWERLLALHLDAGTSGIVVGGTTGESATLTDADLQRIVTIRNEPHTVFEAINRQTAHYGLHTGQILLIGKHLLGAKWKYLTIAPGGSVAFNQAMGIQRPTA